MEFDFIIKIIIYAVIVRVIMSKVKKKKNMGSSEEENSTAKRSVRQKEVRKNKKNIDLSSIKDMMSKSGKPLSPDERMKRREKELENRNKR